jgi:hypothetical protein
VALVFLFNIQTGLILLHGAGVPGTLELTHALCNCRPPSKPASPPKLGEHTEESHGQAMGQAGAQHQ